MNLALVSLVKLQKLDGRIAQLQKIEKEAPIKLAEVELELQHAEQKVEEVVQREKDLQKKRRDLEREIEITEEKVKQNQTRQLQCKTNEEYRAMLKENDFLRKSNTAREDEILEIMEELESLAGEIVTLNAWLEEQRTLLNERKAGIEDWIAQCARDLEPLSVERSLLVKSIPNDHMALYQRVFDKRNGRAVVPVTDGICQECYLQIPPQDYNELHRNDRLMVCPHCDRIIYWAEHEDFDNL